MVILEEHVRSHWGKICSVIVELTKKSKTTNKINFTSDSQMWNIFKHTFLFPPQYV